MVPQSSNDKYIWDIAISLCSQDIEFAKKLVKALNPGLKVFFYEDIQEQFISKSGPEACARVYKNESRIVVILSREEWSNSFYTEIERNAIIDRTSVKNEGFQFLMVIPMVQGETPSWYPSTQIYVRPSRFSVDEIARFIEFKVAETGGAVKNLTVEDRYQNLLERIEVKKSLINSQFEKVAIESAYDEIISLKECFNRKAELLRKQIVDNVYLIEFQVTSGNALLGYGNYVLKCQFPFDFQPWFQMVTTQDLFIIFRLFQVFGNGSSEKLIEEEQRIFYYTPEFKGWALPHLYEQATKSELQVLFRNRNNSKFYDLIKPLPTEKLVDDWFQRLFLKSTEIIERYI